MPGPFHYALARPYGDADGEQGVIVALSENWQDNGGRALFRFWPMEGCCYPHLFLQQRRQVAMKGGAYQVLDASMWEQKHQEIYIYQSYGVGLTLFCHTPGLDAPGVYSVWDSDSVSRDQSWRMIAQDLHYRSHWRHEGRGDVVIEMAAMVKRSRL